MRYYTFIFAGLLISGCASALGLSPVPTSIAPVPHVPLVKGVMQQPGTITGQEHFLWCASCPERTLKLAVPSSVRAYRNASSKGSPAKASPITIRFNFNSAIVNTDGISELKAVSLRATAGSVISIIGYTDSVGSNLYNRQLAHKRATAVHDWLRSHIKKHVRYTIHAHGKCCYARKPGLSPENRRVEVNITGGKKEWKK